MPLRPSQLGGEDIVEMLIIHDWPICFDAGKKGGEFYTPAEVSELLARLVKPQENQV